MTEFGDYNPYVEELMQKFKFIVDKLKGLTWYQRRFKRPEALIAEYYRLDRELSQLMDHRSLSKEQYDKLLPIWQAGYDGLYKYFPE